MTGQSFCLRRWPLAHPTAEQLDWINLVLVHARNNGCPVVAAPLETINGTRYIHYQEFYWELAPWMPGKSTFAEDPNDTRLENAITTLAKFHLASAQVNLGFGKSKNANARLASLRGAPDLIEQISQSKPAIENESVSRLRRVVLAVGATRAAELGRLIAPFTEDIFPNQPVIRDVWHDHVLFTGDKVTGLVDFGAMQLDNVALDVARLLGSLVGDQQERWQYAIEAYSKIRNLSDKEIQFSIVMDRVATLLGSLNWLKWILVERREFESMADVERKINFLLARWSDEI